MTELHRLRELLASKVLSYQEEKRIRKQIAELEKKEKTKPKVPPQLPLL